MEPSHAIAILLGITTVAAGIAALCVWAEKEEQLEKVRTRLATAEADNGTLKAEIARLKASPPEPAKTVRIDPRPDGDPPRVIDAPPPALPSFDPVPTRRRPAK